MFLVVGTSNKLMRKRFGLFFTLTMRFREPHSISNAIYVFARRLVSERTKYKRILTAVGTPRNSPTNRVDGNTEQLIPGLT